MRGALSDLLRLARDGGSVGALAARLDVPPDLAEVMLDHADRLGLVERLGPADGRAGGCAGCPATEASPGGVSRRLPLSCAGCPLAPDGVRRR